MYSIGKFSKLIGKSQNTLRNWNKEGILIPAFVSKSGHRSYSDEQLNLFLSNDVVQSTKINIGYIRVSSKKQSDDLKRQENVMENYLLNKNKPFKIINQKISDQSCSTLCKNINSSCLTSYQVIKPYEEYIYYKCNENLKDNSKPYYCMCGPPPN